MKTDNIKNCNLEEYESLVDIDTIEINIEPFLPCFCQKGCTQETKTTGVDIVAIILDEIKVKRLKSGDGYTFVHFSTGNYETVKSNDEKYLRAEKIKLAKRICNTISEEGFENITPEKSEEKPGWETYNQFENEPEKAAHFMYQRFLTPKSEGGGTHKMICKNVMHVKFNDNLSGKIDFTLVKKEEKDDDITKLSDDELIDGYFAGKGLVVMPPLYKLHRHYTLFKAFYGKKPLEQLSIQDALDSLDTSVSFRELMDYMKDCCKNPTSTPLEYYDDKTGWRCSFGRIDNNKLRLYDFYNRKKKNLEYNDDFDDEYDDEYVWETIDWTKRSNWRNGEITEEQWNHYGELCRSGWKKEAKAYKKRCEKANNTVLYQAFIDCGEAYYCG